MAQGQGLAGTRVPDSEKITINLGHVDLGYVDLLVAEGVYANRSDFIRTAIRNQIGRHADITKQSVERRSVELGLCRIGRADLEAARAEGIAVAGSALEAAEGAEVVITMLPAGRHVVEVWTQLAAAVPAGTLLIDSSTVDV